MPFPGFGTINKRLTLALSFGVIVYLIMSILKPFGISELSASEIQGFSIAYGVTTWVITSFCLVILPMLFPRFYMDEHWTIGKEMLFTITILSLISIGNSVTLHLLQGSKINWNLFLNMYFFTVIIGFVPISIGIFIKQHVLTQRYRKQALELMQSAAASETSQKSLVEPSPIDIKPDSAHMRHISPKHITLTGDNQEDILTIATTDIVMLTAEDNYVKITYYTSDGSLRSAMFRSTLKKMEDQLAHCDGIMRCHRSYIIHTVYLSEIYGDAQGVKVLLRNIRDVIPVGKTYIDTLRSHWKILQSAS
jgi:hypothetical protein